jgi:hypothetical protein
MSNIMNTHIGANKPYLITFNGNPFAGADSRQEAEAMIANYRKVPKGRQDTVASKGTWAVISQDK